MPPRRIGQLRYGSLFSIHRARISAILARSVRRASHSKMFAPMDSQRTVSCAGISSLQPRCRSRAFVVLHLAFSFLYFRPARPATPTGYEPRLNSSLGGHSSRGISDLRESRRLRMARVRHDSRVFPNSDRGSESHIVHAVKFAPKVSSSTEAAVLSTGQT